MSHAGPDHSTLAAGRWQTFSVVEQFCRVFFDAGAERDLADYLRQYFMLFAVAARRNVNVR